MKEVYYQINHHHQQQQQQNQQQNHFKRLKELEQTIQNQKSLISYDGLLDGIQALVLDCEPMKKNKNIDNFLGRCNLLICFLIKKK